MKIYSFLIQNRKKVLFFAFFYLFVGSCGIWVPALFAQIGVDDIAIGLITIIISSMYSSAEKILSILSIGRKDNGLEGIVYLIAVAIPFAISLLIGKLIFEDCDILALIISCILYICSWGLWWFQNSNNPALIENISDVTLGGSCDQFNND